MSYRVTIEQTAKPEDSVTSATCETVSEAISDACESLGLSPLAFTFDVTDNGVLVLDSYLPTLRATVEAIA